MRTFISSCYDILFPPGAHARLVQKATPALVETQYAPHKTGDITALARYRAPLMRALLHEAKFRHNDRALALLGYLLSVHLRKEDLHTAHLVPIPLTKQRLRERGYNQIERIAHAARVHVPTLTIHDTLLTKVRHTRPQSSLKRRDRLANLTDVFTVSVHDLSHTEPLIVLDDITTTGTTLREAAQTLARAGFTDVRMLAIAH